MNETKGLVKCIFGLLLSIVVIVGGAFGLNVQVSVEDAETTPPEVVETTIAEVVETTPEEKDVLTTETVVETQQSPAESTQTEDEAPIVESSVEVEVTEPADETQQIVTEKGEN